MDRLFAFVFGKAAPKGRFCFIKIGRVACPNSPVNAIRISISPATPGNFAVCITSAISSCNPSLTIWYRSGHEPMECISMRVFYLNHIAWADFIIVFVRGNR